MTDVPLARHLTRFSAQVAPPLALPPPYEEPEPDVFVDLEPIVLEEPEPAEPEITLTVAAYEESLAAARQSAREEADAAHATVIETLAAEHEEALGQAVAAARAEVIADESKVLATTITDAFDTLKRDLAGALADVLRPLLSDAVSARALAALTEALHHVLADEKHPALVIRGSAERLEALRAALEQHDGLRFVEADLPEVEVIADGLRVTTQIGAALAALTATDKVD